MKVLFVGASGFIGGECLRQCLSHPDITGVVAFVRRNLPSDITRNPKLKCVTVRDFSVWPQDVLQANADATAMIWAMGTYSGSRNADLEYPLAFLESMGRVLEKKQPAREQPFRYIHLSGMFTRQDQEKKLLFLEFSRKIRGLFETKAQNFAENHTDSWKVFIARPGGVAANKYPGTYTVASILGDNWCIRLEELGAYMTYLAVAPDAEKEGLYIQNDRIAKKGREFLQLQRGEMKPRTRFCD